MYVRIHNTYPRVMFEGIYLHLRLAYMDTYLAWYGMAGNGGGVDVTR